MARIGILIAIALIFGGCATGTTPPDPLLATAYGEPLVVVETPGIEDGTLGLGGVWAARHAVYIDLVLDVPAGAGSESRARMAQLEAYVLDGSGRWFGLESLSGPVELERRSSPNEPLGDDTRSRRSSPRRLEAPPGRDRWAICAWYSTKKRLEPGTYRLVVSEPTERATGMRADLGLRQLNGTLVQVRPYSDRPNVRHEGVGTLMMP